MEPVLQALRGRIPAAPPTAAYRMGLAVVAVAMILLPLVYIALVGVAGWGLWYHATENLDWLSGRGSARGRLFAYAAPLVIGAVILLFMIKPLFARPARGADPRALRKAEQPLLFAFIERLCRVLDAPMPGRIDVDCAINAAAGHTGMVTISRGTLVLTIGLPLAAGLSLRQFAGVLAHEFGHFSQRAGMGLSGVVRRINHWFARVVYERDSWDDKLVEWSQAEGGGISVTLLVARGFVWLTRQVLRLLMMAGHAISCFLLRQMEHDADGYEARLAGSATFEQTALRLRELSVAGQQAYEQLGEFWRERRLPDDLPALIVATAERFPEPLRAAIAADARESRTRLFDTHPSDSERIERARAGGHRGLLAVDGPARQLFADFEGLCREVTLRHYTDLLGEVRKESLVPLQEALQGQQRGEAAEEAMERWTAGLAPLERPLFPGVAEVEPAPSRAEGLAALARAGEAFQAVSAASGKAVLSYRKGWHQRRSAQHAARLMRVNVALDARTFDLPTATAEGARRGEERARQLMEGSSALVEQGQAALRARLLAGLAAAPHVGGVEQESWPRCLRALHALEQAFPAVERVHDEFVALATLARCIPGREDNAPLIAAIREGAAALAAALGGLLDSVPECPYPFPHAGGGVSVADYLRPDAILEDDLGALLGTAEGVMDNVFSLYRRALGELARTVEQVEELARQQPDRAAS